MFRFELYKSLRRKEILVIIIVGIVLEMLISSQSNLVVPEDVNVKVYKDYIKKLEGTYTVRRHEWVVKERDRYRSYIDNSKKYAEQYDKGEIDAETYRDLKEKVEDAGYKIGTLEYLVMKSDYLGALSAEGEDAKYFYDLDVNDYVENMGVDIVVVLLITVIAVHIFTEDRNCGTWNMVWTSGYGRRKLFLARLSCVTGISVIIGTIFPIIEYVVKQRKFNLGNQEAGIRCLLSMSDSGLSISIKEYFILTIITRIVAALMLSIIVMGISLLVKNVIADYVLPLGIVYLPALTFDKLGRILKEISFSKGFASYQGFRMPQKMFGIHGMFIWLICYVAVCVLIVTAWFIRDNMNKNSKHRIIKISN